jgi:hypothetical protein
LGYHGYRGNTATITKVYNMAKQTTPAPAAPAPTAVAAAVAAGPKRVPTVPNVPGTLNVLKANCTFKGARAAWYASLQQYNGKPVNDWLAAVHAKRPSLPLSGNPEPVSGWWAWFVRQGIAAAVVTPAKQANK